MSAKAVRIIALSLTAIVAILHATYVFHAGGLWRDEANTVALAKMASVKVIWENLEFDSFPVFWPLVLRCLQYIGLTDDFAFRLIGCVVGLSIIAALWLVARFMRYSVPLVSLVLIGFSPTILRWGDSMRAYGFGVLMLLLAFGFIWMVVRSPSPWVVALAAVSAIASVQTLYYNSIILFAIGIAGTIVAIRNRKWVRAIIVLSICGFSAITLIPYLGTIQSAKEWNIVFASQEFTFPYFWMKLSEALSSAGRGVNWIWAIVTITAIVSGTVAQFRPLKNEDSIRRDAALFCTTSLLVGIPAYFAFLNALSYPTQPWYYVALMGLVAVAVDGALAGFPIPKWSRIGRIAAAVAIAIWTFVPAWHSSHTRQTNIDLIANKLAELAAAGDTIVVAPFYFGVTFDRYFEGTATWMTIPPIDVHEVHRYDLVKEKMAATDPIAPVLAAMEKALKSGNRVWIVGGLQFLQPGQTPPLLAPAPYDSVGWSEGAYATAWSMETAHFLQTHALGAESVDVKSGPNINPYENVGLLVVQGWKGY